MTTTFTTQQVDDAIRASNHSMATGPNGLEPEHLKHLGSRAIEYLTALFNLSVGNADIPSIWKKALVLQLSKWLSRESR
jgi:hypothetical protein